MLAILTFQVMWKSQVMSRNRISIQGNGVELNIDKGL